MLSFRVPTSSSSFFRSTSTCRALCFIASRLAALSANCDSRCFSLQRQRFYFGFDLPDLLLSILKDEKLFEFSTHGPLKLLTLRSVVNRARRSTSSHQLLPAPVPVARGRRYFRSD